MKKLLAFALVGLVVVGGGAVAYAQEDAPPTTPTSESAQPAHHHARLRRRTVHGDLTVRTKDGFKQVTVDRGRLTSVDGSTITVTRPDGPVVTFTINGDTRFRGISSASELQTGKPVFVVSTGGIAKGVAQRK